MLFRSVMNIFPDVVWMTYYQTARRLEVRDRLASAPRTRETDAKRLTQKKRNLTSNFREAAQKSKGSTFLSRIPFFLSDVAIILSDVIEKRWRTPAVQVQADDDRMDAAPQEIQAEAVADDLFRDDNHQLASAKRPASPL